MTNLTAVVKQLEAERARIDSAIKALQGIGSISGKQRKRGGISVAGRKRIAAAQRARWAKIKRAKRKGMKRLAT